METAQSTTPTAEMALNARIIDFTSKVNGRAYRLFVSIPTRRPTPPEGHAVLYLIDGKGRPVRLGFALGNEYSDHVTERQNYLYLAHSKLRHSSIGPEMVTGKIPASIEGMSRIIRGGQVIWEKPFLTGEANMSHTIANLEYHHFKYDGFRRPGDLHIHYFGTATLSIADNVKTEDGDVFEISAPAFGAALRNPLKAMKPGHKPGSVKAL